MNTEEIIKLARKVGGYDGFTSPPTDWDEGDFVISPEALLKFATLVRNEALEALKAEVESLRTDAERYRWLRDKGDSITVCECASDGEWIPLHPKNIDVTIDAALEEAAKEKSNGHW